MHASIPVWLIKQTVADIEELALLIRDWPKKDKKRSSTLVLVRRSYTKLSQDARYLREVSSGLVRRRAVQR